MAVKVGRIETLPTTIGNQRKRGDEPRWETHKQACFAKVAPCHCMDRKILGTKLMALEIKSTVTTAFRTVNSLNQISPWNK